MRIEKRVEAFKKKGGDKTGMIITHAFEEVHF